ncbi:MAG: hypothetical protein U9R66_07560 [Thermodesulfobacteriota bacterium]|nr:hypothetical protein [Thermodesulfobacteriota bacterium]
MREKKIHSSMKAGCCILGLAAVLVRLTAGGAAIASIYYLTKKHRKSKRTWPPATQKNNAFSNRV